MTSSKETKLPLLGSPQPCASHSPFSHRDHVSQPMARPAKPHPRPRGQARVGAGCAGRWGHHQDEGSSPFQSGNLGATSPLKMTDVVLGAGRGRS